jgi:hypothetical protein
MSGVTITSPEALETGPIRVMIVSSRDLAALAAVLGEGSARDDSDASRD